ncbi:Protein of unknown function [Pyronema omphalodes CBS 100304]|uniref:Uncharacterized protein n=1 Tax=Pyronema omphalodes (strain CBS 100304) TaxID=1076935 RepID=U4KYE5_PYROM|nr:Protein of unknown function [Pyronema omphalodes CBS 100304]
MSGHVLSLDLLDGLGTFGI